MKSIIDYLHSHLNDSFFEVGFSNVDALIFSAFTYARFTQVNDGVSIEELSKQPLDLSQVRVKEDLELVKLMGQSKRYGALTASDYTSILKVGYQFGAITLADETSLYIAFRGTDNTIEGWKEDFDMSFSSIVPSQIASAEYVESVANKYPEKKLYIMGHSKGGNLAVYAYLKLPEELLSRVVTVYNYDGPGFNEVMNLSSRLQKYEKHIHTFVPESSVVGMLLEHVENYKVVKSSRIGIFQHDPYSWFVEKDNFFFLTDRDRSSYYLDSVIHDWLKDIKPEEREEFINLVYSAIAESGYEHFDEVLKFFFLDIKNLRSFISKMDDEKKTLVKTILKKLVKAQNDTLKIYLGK